MIGERIADFAHGVAGQWLVDTLVVTACLMAAVLVLRRPVARHFGASMAYALWAVPLARLFMPPLTQTIKVPVSDPATQAGAMAMPVAGMAAPSDAVPQGALANGLLIDADWFAIGVTVWLCGAAIFLIAQLSTYLQNRRELLDDAVQVAQIDDIRVIEIAGISGPFAFGLLRRYIALPIGFTQAYNPMERELALAHERSHHRAGDLWANFAALAMLSLHWFNPIAWMAWRAFRFDQEAACDARVLRARSAAERSAYARAIAKAATGNTLAFASPLNPRGKIVERLSMMKQKDASRTRKWLGGALIGGGLVTAMAMTATVSYAIQPVLSPDAPEAPAAPQSPASPPAPPSAPSAPDVPDAPDTPEAPDAPQAYMGVGGDREFDRAMANADWARAEADRAVAHADSVIADVDRHAAAADRAMAIAERNRAQAVAQARRVAVRSGSADNYVVDMGEGRSLRVQTSECAGKAKSAAFMTHTETRGSTVTRSKIVSCGQVMPDEAAIAANIEKGLAEARKNMALARVEIRNNPHMSARERAEAMRELDQGIRELNADLAQARQELRRDMEEARRELRESLAERN